MIHVPVLDLHFIKSKYNIPIENQKRIPRTRLYQTFDRILQYKITTITAPAGYGKTSSLISWIHGKSIPTVWYSIDENDNYPSVFWQYFILSMQHIIPDIYPKMKSILTSNELCESQLHLNYLLDAIETVDFDFLIVLDHMDLIEDFSIKKGLSYFLSYLPFNVHLVFIGRTTFNLPLAEFILKDDLLTITNHDICFDKAETFDFFVSKGYYLQEQEILSIYKYTKGWPAALVAISLSMNEQNSLRPLTSEFHPSSQALEQYLEEHVYPMWSKKQQEFLEKTSILDRFSIPLCSYIAQSDATSFIKELSLERSFLECVDYEEELFKYHPVFLDFLKKRYLANNPNEAFALFAKAGEWLEKNDQPQQAIHYYMKGNHYSLAIPLIEKHGSRLFREGKYTLVLSWIDHFSEELKKEHPILYIFQTYYYILENHITRAKHNIHILAQLQKNLEYDSYDLKTAYFMLITNMLMIRGDMQGSMKNISIYLNYALKHNIHVDYIDFNLYDISLSRSIYYSLLRFIRKNPEEYKTYIRDYQTLTRTPLGYPSLAFAELYYEANDLVRALHYASIALDEAARITCPGALVPAIILIARIKRAHGDIAGAIKTIEEFEDTIASFHALHWSYLLLAFKTRLYLEENQFDEVQSWLNHAKLGIYHELSRTREYSMIVYARCLMKKNMFDSATILLNRLLTFAESLERPHSIVEILNLLGMVSVNTMEEDLAYTYINRSLTIAIEESFVQSYLDELSPMTHLLQLYIRKSTNYNAKTAYAKKLIHMMTNAERNSVVPLNQTSLTTILTPTERKILSLLVKAYTNKEIAEELCVAVRTVTTHTGNIYKKLGVKSRTQCIQKTREYELL